MNSIDKVISEAINSGNSSYTIETKLPEEVRIIESKINNLIELRASYIKSSLVSPCDATATEIDIRNYQRILMNDAEINLLKDKLSRLYAVFAKTIIHINKKQDVYKNQE